MIADCGYSWRRCLARLGVTGKTGRQTREERVPFHGESAGAQDLEFSLRHIETCQCVREAGE